MIPALHLFFHNVFGIGSAIILIGLAFFTYLGSEKKDAEIVTWVLTLISAAVFLISHVVGVSTSDPEISKFVLMWNLSILAIAAFNTHSVLVSVGKAKSHKLLIEIIYAITAGLIIFFILNPGAFLLNSVPKMYFPNYYEPGPLNWLRIFVLFGLCVPYMFYLLGTAWKRAENKSEINKFKYLFFTLIVGYVVGFIPNFLVYNIPIDPMLGMFVAILAIPFLYGAVRFEMLHIKVIAKQAFFYTIAVGFIGALIIIFNITATELGQYYPQFPTWSLAFISALLLVSITVIIWRYLRAADILRYEFATVVTHKFKTPLTHINLATETLERGPLTDEQKTMISYIKDSNLKLVELTNIISRTSDFETRSFHYDRGELSLVAEEVFEHAKQRHEKRKVTVTSEISPALFAKFDPEIRFPLRTLIDNAYTYTPDGGSIAVKMARHGSDIIFSVADNGIGIQKSEMPLVFSKFYRSAEAKVTDTEGMGIGLYISKVIIEKHGGKVWAQSQGPGKGSTFSFSLPTADASKAVL